MNRNDTPESAGERESRKPSIPRNLEVLIKKASVDPEFRRLLLDKRTEATRELDLLRQFGFYPDPTVGTKTSARDKQTNTESCGARSPRIEPQNLATRTY